MALRLENNLGNKFSLTHANNASEISLTSKDLASTKLVDSIAELRLISGSTTDKLEVLGYYEKGDGGGGLFYWDSTSNEEDNGGTIIQSTGVTTGRWKRVYSGAVNVKWFGAVGDGVTSDSASINSALSYAHKIGGCTVFVPAGSYRLTNILKIGSNTSLICESAVRLLKDHDATFINNGLGFDYSSVIPAYEGHGNIVIDGGTWEGFAFGRFDGYTGFALGYGKNITLRNITLLDSIGPGHAVDMSCCDGVLFENCKFLGCAAFAGEYSIQDCIQLDHNVEGTFPYFGVPVFKQNRNITVRGCTFGSNPDNADVRFGPHYIGVGAHGSVYGEWPENIQIEGNTFIGCLFTGVRVFKWKNTKIVNNTFSGSNSQIHVTSTPAGSVSSQDVNRVQQNQAEASDNLLITGNTFRNSAAHHILVNSIAFGTDTSIRHKNIVIEANYGDTCTQYFASLSHCQSVNITGNNANNCGSGFYTMSADISEGVSITGNVITNTVGIAGSFGVLYLNGTNGREFNISNNTFKGVANGRGIHATSSVSNGIIANNTFEGIAGHATVLQANAARWLIVGNQFITTNLTQDTILQTPVYASSSCLGIIATSNQNSPLNVTAPVPVSIEAGGGGYADVQYAGTPNGVIRAPIGSICRNTSGGTSTTLYVKESGAGNTGWVAK